LESLDQCRRLEVGEKARNVFCDEPTSVWPQVLHNIASSSSFFRFRSDFPPFFARISYFKFSELNEFNKTIIPFALVGYETGYGQLYATPNVTKYQGDQQMNQVKQLSVKPPRISTNPSVHQTTLRATDITSSIAQLMNSMCAPRVNRMSSWMLCNSRPWFYKSRCGFFINQEVRRRPPTNATFEGNRTPIIPLLSRTSPAKCVDILQDVLQGILQALHPNSLDNVVHTAAKGRLNLWKTPLC